MLCNNHYVHYVFPRESFKTLFLLSEPDQCLHITQYHASTTIQETSGVKEKYVKDLPYENGF